MCTGSVDAFKKIAMLLDPTKTADNEQCGTCFAYFVDDVKNLYKGYDLLRTVREIFEKWEIKKKSSRIPMEALADLLIMNILSRPINLKEEG